MNIYADLQDASVLEVGSHSVNGSLRDNALPTTRYVGIDIEQGEGVDIVFSPGQPLPVENGTFDLVMASSVFEHDACFWMTFLEMCRATKEGGYIYVNAPSNGIVHRYPQDNWRFYPDSGKALVQWAVSQGQFVMLVESFIADREHDIWNDFVAVFRKGRSKGALPKVFIHEHLPCSNVQTWKSKEVLNPRDAPEDMLLLVQANERARAADDALAEATEDRNNLAAQVAKISAELTQVAQQRDQSAEANDRLRAELDDLDAQAKRQLADLRTQMDGARNDLKVRENELRQRQEEIEQTRSELTQVRAVRDDLRSRASELELALERLATQYAELERQSFARQTELENELSAANAERIEQLHALRTEMDSARSEFADALARAEADAREAEQNVRQFAGEIEALTLLVEQEKALREGHQELSERLRQIGHVLHSSPNWWHFLPSSWRRRKERELLVVTGLFDGEAYLKQNPDVAEARVDPLGHYLEHGLAEGRSSSSGPLGARISGADSNR